MKGLWYLIKSINQLKINSYFILEKLFVMTKKCIVQPDLSLSLSDTESYVLLMIPWCCAMFVTQHYVGRHGSGFFTAAPDSAFSAADWFHPPSKSMDK